MVVDWIDALFDLDYDTRESMQPIIDGITSELDFLTGKPRISCHCRPGDWSPGRTSSTERGG